MLGPQRNIMAQNVVDRSVSLSMLFDDLTTVTEEQKSVYKMPEFDVKLTKIDVVNIRLPLGLSYTKPVKVSKDLLKENLESKKAFQFDRIVPINPDYFSDLLLLESFVRDGFYYISIDGNDVLLNGSDVFNSTSCFYRREVQYKHNKYVVYIVGKTILGSNKILYNVFNLNGINVFNYLDEVLENSFLKRTYNNNSSVIIDLRNKKVVNQIWCKTLNSLKPKPLKRSQINYQNRVDLRIGTIDLETYSDKNNISKPYAIGYYTRVDSPVFVIHYLGYEYEFVDSLNSKGVMISKAVPVLKKVFNHDDLIINFFVDLLKPRNNNFTFYVHNLGGYDAPFFIKVLSVCDKFDLKLTSKHGCVLSMRVSTKYLPKKVTVVLVDSRNILAGSLDKLAETFNSDVKKGIFPYNYVKSNTLWVTNGNKPSEVLWELNTEGKRLLYQDIPNSG